MSVAGRHEFSPADADMLFGELIVLGMGGESYDYVSAEQATRAIDLLASAAGNRYAAQIDRLFEAVQDEDDYRPERYIRVLRTFPVD